MKHVIVFGNDHTNTVGVVQALAKNGIDRIDTLLYGEVTGYVKASKYVSHLYTAPNADLCVGLLLDNVIERKSDVVIIPCSDSAAIALYANKERLQSKGFLCGGGIYKSTEVLSFFDKSTQVKNANMVGFDVPISSVINDKSDLLQNKVYPCLIKPLVSAKGAKNQIRICRNYEELLKEYLSIGCSPNVILQQYIDRDYEISILGCALKDGTCVIPAVEEKLTLYPKLVGLECLANIKPLTDGKIRDNISALIKKIGYVGLFSVEMMHCKDDEKVYFTEINLRNDGAQSFILKYGVNLPLVHVYDLLGLPIPEFSDFFPGYYIWDMHHLKSLLSLDISIVQWGKEILKSKGFLMYDKKDNGPFYRQYIYMLKKCFNRKRVKSY